MSDHLPQSIVLESAEYTPLSSSAVSLLFPEHGIVNERKVTSNTMDPPEYLEFEEVKQPISARKLFDYFPLRALDGRQGWKPITLKAPFLGVLVLSSLSIIAVLEILSYRSSGGNGGGLAFATDLDSLPKLTIFKYLYFPTILAVFYSMMWSWVDLDAKRLEPWFRLSTPCGALAKDSICLQYPFDFLPFIPINALRRRHWGVFFAGTIMLIVFWIITPLQSAIFNTGTVTRTIKMNMMTTSQPLPLGLQATALNANFLNTAYGISWLNQSLPPFSTRQYIVLPFQPYPAHQLSAHSETWTATTDAFSTSLLCSPANITLTPLGYNFSNGKGCTTSEIVLATAKNSTSYMIDYIGYFDDANIDNALSNPDCPPKFSNTFLALWASGASRNNSGPGMAVYNNLTALFCETNYSSQRLSVVVNATSNAIISSTPVIDHLNHTNDFVDVYSIFNTTTFEYTIGTGVIPRDQPINLPGRARLNQSPELIKYNLPTDLVNNMVQFAVALNPLTVEDLVSPTALHTAFESAHQLLFTTALSSLLQETPNPNMTLVSTSNGIVQDSVGAITFVRPVAIAVEAAVGSVAALATALWYFSHRRPSRLRKDPSSIAEVMSFLRAGRNAPAMFDSFDRLKSTDLCLLLAHRSYRLDDSLTEVVSTRSLCDGRGSSETIEDLAAAMSITPRASDALTVHQRELHVSVGITFCAILLLTASGLVFIYTRSVQYGGLHLPTSNSVVLSILENYLPTAFATFFEPIWVILNRILCLLIPFEALRHGNARSKASIEADYTSLPPQFVIWRALRSGHFLLAVVCLVAVSTNLLSVTMSTLLNEGLVTVNSPMPSQQLLRPIFNDGGTAPAISFFTEGYDHFYTLLSHVAHNTSLPSWVDGDYFYFPFTRDLSPSRSGSNQVQQFRGSTLGFGAAASCNLLSPGEGDHQFLFRTSQDGAVITLQTSHLLSNGTLVTCLPTGGSWFANQTIGRVPLGSLAVEFMQPMLAPQDIDDGGFCSNLFVIGWARADNLPGLSSNSTTFNLSSTTFLACTGITRAAQFQVIVDASGHILDSTQTSPFSANTTQYFSGDASEMRLINEAINLMNEPVSQTAVDFTAVAPLGTWHNSSYTSDWMNSLLVIILNSQDLVDPSAPIPDGNLLATVMGELYQQLFAIILALAAPSAFPSAESSAPFLIEALSVETRLFVAPTMFRITITLLLLHFIVAVFYYVYRPGKYLPRLPTSIAAVISYVYASRALEDFGISETESEGRKRRYAFGRFVGTDGKTHIGIERQEYIIPLETRNPGVKRKRWNWRWKAHGKEPRNWI